MRYPRVLFSAICLAAVWLGPVEAGPITYVVNVNTSALNGHYGYVDFQFNPGGTAEAATATVTAFTPAGNLNAADPNNAPSGDVSGSLTSTLTLNNDTAFNDFFEGFNIGNSIGFDVTLSGTALDSPGGSSGSSFAFSLYDNTGTTPLLTTDPNGSVLTLNVNPDGSTTVETFPQSSTDSNPVAGATPLGGATAVPEPSSMMLVISALPVGLLAWCRRRWGVAALVG
jgi:hypothetical protein